jgi:hypothetical protein
MIDSCDHGDYIVNYEVGKRDVCPVCDLVSDHEHAIQALKEEIASLESEIE